MRPGSTVSSGISGVVGSVGAEGSDGADGSVGPVGSAGVVSVGWSVSVGCSVSGVPGARCGSWPSEEPGSVGSDVAGVSPPTYGVTFSGR